VAGTSGEAAHAASHGFDTEAKLARIAAEVKAIQESRKKEPAKK
jgi:hypothetical protein